MAFGTLSRDKAKDSKHGVAVAVNGLDNDTLDERLLERVQSRDSSFTAGILARALNNHTDLVGNTDNAKSLDPSCEKLRDGVK